MPQKLLFGVWMWNFLLCCFAAFVAISESAGGIAEMKALTGDAPYMGTGNMEQAPEFFGDAAARQAYMYDFYGPSRYQRNFANSFFYRPWRSYGGDQPMPSNNGLSPPIQAAVIQPGPPGPPGPDPVSSSALSQAVGGGFYKGSGNSWTKQS